VWVGFDDKQISLGKKETGARAASYDPVVALAYE
jgi:membrane carboxypeptidase/penicillin-binding protein